MDAILQCPSNRHRHVHTSSVETSQLENSISNFDNGMFIKNTVKAKYLQLSPILYFIFIVSEICLCFAKTQKLT